MGVYKRQYLQAHKRNERGRQQDVQHRVILAPKIYFIQINNKNFSNSVKDLHWKSYIEQYCLGTKKYALKEDMTRMNKCRKQLAK